MNIYEAKVGDVVITGASYGASPCVCVRDKYFNENYGFDCVDFLCLVTGKVHSSGGRPGYSKDFCQLIERIDEVKLNKLKEVWKYDPDKEV